ncbi:alternative ribosome rescue aminoacyl-tRNA hydrolase ArfB [Kribbella sp. NPDC003505]|uniref:alternative ribosome rescue aminoacyl-tRNA hydrolase ArfB n=1 Tax=Kribbella sp. NPDC003505 TaxID=3154448 RepID=UPI0033BB2562
MCPGAISSLGNGRNATATSSLAIQRAESAEIRPQKTQASIRRFSSCLIGPVESGVTVRSGVVIPEAELAWRFSRSSGPGGQSVNTTDSRVELSFDVAGTSALSDVLKARALERLGPRLVDGVLTIAASEYKSQWRNREAARERLAVLVREAIAPPPRKRRPTKPSKASVRRRLDDKKRRGETKRLRGRPND